MNGPVNVDKQGYGDYMHMCECFYIVLRNRSLKSRKITSHNFFFFNVWNACGMGRSFARNCIVKATDALVASDGGERMGGA